MFNNPKPAGWTDDIDKITGQQIGTIATQLVNAADAIGGGSYSLAFDLEFNGVGQVVVNGAGATFGTDGGAGITFARRTGLEKIIGPNARTQRRASVAVSGAADATVDLSTSERFEFGAPTAARTYTLGITTGNAPFDGEEKILRWTNTNAFQVNIKNEGGVANIFTIAAGVYAVEMRVWFESGAWHGGMYSANVTPGASY